MSSSSTVEQVKAWSRENVKTWNRTRLDLEDGDIYKIYNQRVNGDIFLALKYEMFVNPPLKLVELINEIRDKQASFLHAFLYLSIIPNTYLILYFSNPPKKTFTLFVELGKYHDCIRLYQTYTAFLAVISFFFYSFD